MALVKMCWQEFDTSGRHAPSAQPIAVIKGKMLYQVKLEPTATDCVSTKEPVAKKMKTDRAVATVCHEVVEMVAELQCSANSETHESPCCAYGEDQAMDAEVVAQQDAEPTAERAGEEMEDNACGGAMAAACANQQPDTAASTGTNSGEKPTIVHLDAPANLKEAGYGDYYFRPNCSSSLWVTILLWMSGECQSTGK